MTKCDKCGNEVGELYCGHCREAIESKHKEPAGKLIPLLFFNTETKGYVIFCQCHLCPYNNKGKCVTEFSNFETLKLRLHKFDGDNIVDQFCG